MIEWSTYHPYIHVGLTHALYYSGRCVVTTVGVVENTSKTHSHNSSTITKERLQLKSPAFPLSVRSTNPGSLPGLLPAMDSFEDADVAADDGEPLGSDAMLLPSGSTITADDHHQWTSNNDCSVDHPAQQAQQQQWRPPPQQHMSFGTRCAGVEASLGRCEQ